jgi:hypothetical protein
VAVFSYDDPARTGLGNTLARIMAHRILIVGGRVSLGVIRYESFALGRTSVEELTYFDRVDRVLHAQRVTMAVWGSIHPTAGGWRVDTFLQIAGPDIPRWTQRLATGSTDCGTLQAHLKPERVALQSLVIGQDDLERLRRQGDELLLLRQSPGGRSIRILSTNTFYKVVKIEMDFVQVETTREWGWLPAAPKCGGACEELVAAADFAAHFVRFLRKREAPYEPSFDRALGPDALAIVEQIRALNPFLWLSSTKPVTADARARLQESIRLANEWSRTDATVDTRSQVAQVGRAVFANVRALSRIALLARVADERARRSEIKEIAFELAQAVQDDPRNVDALENLALLFRCAGDAERSRVAAELAQEAEAFTAVSYQGHRMMGPDMRTSPAACGGCGGTGSPTMAMAFAVLGITAFRRRQRRSR